MFGNHLLSKHRLVICVIPLIFTLSYLSIQRFAHAEIQPPENGADSEQISRSQRLETLSKMQTTCQRWTRWYKRDKSENARINMNIACRDAASYSKNMLGMEVEKVTYVPDKTSAAKTKSSKKQASLLKARRLSAVKIKGKPRCEYWENQIEKVQKKLRSGYKEPTGNALRQQRRNYRLLIRDNC